ncbi:transcription antiterminator [Vagococcus sp. BWB3-3]|uniref:Transcription antiterminator n=1 Tax=Vagococcus allomyrinae TaxID=2794353 RepID=A0A940PCG3_9ENTE|nr:BglG family transcription antiterminator [Vagococcus allomyrinae]MBP1042414.1 transcription antiterminator [Vagococcus allomyrinae]
MLSKRQKELLELLIEQEEFQTVKFFSRKLGVSERTLHSELTLVEDYLNSSEAYIEKKRGVGIVLRLPREGSQSSEEPEMDVFSILNRRIQMMELLLFSPERISFNGLSELFMVSKTSIKNDLDYVMQILTVSNDVRLTSSSQGTKLSGSEEELQKAFLQFNRYLLSHSDGYLDEVISEKIKLFEAYYGEQVVSVCTNVLYSYVKEHVNAISDYYIQNVLNVLIILVYRIIEGHHIQLSDKQVGGDYDTIFFEESASQMLNKAALRLSFSYTEQEVKYLAQHLISNRFKNLPKAELDQAIVTSILESVSESLSIDFTQDEKLEEQLKNHIPPMIYRLKLNNTTENPFTSHIKNEFSLTFNVIWLVLSEYEKELAIVFTEDEIAFLTMYFQAAIERARINRKILVVCQMGIATSEFLINRIKNKVPSLDTLEVASVPELGHINLDSFDLIVSTIKINLPNREVIHVSPFLSDEDIVKITNADYRKLREQRTEMQGALERAIQPAFMEVDSEYNSKEELIEKVGAKLVAEGLVKPEFLISVSDREELGGTDLPSGTAVPHGSSLYVEQTVIVVIKNKKKFKWSQYYVDVIFMICISERDIKKTRGILSDIYTIIDDPTKLKEIRGVSSKALLLKTIGSEHK